MENDQLFLALPPLQAKFANKRGMPRPPRPVPAPAMHTADLTQAVIKYIRARGGYAVRINCSGIYDQKAGRWRKSTTERGTADIHGCIDGKHLSIEIKTGDDRMSDYQRKVQDSVTKSGGIYLIISEFSEFHNWFANRNIV